MLPKKMIDAAQGGGKSALEEAEKELIRHAKQSQNKARLDAMISIAQTSSAMAVSQAVMDGVDMLLGIKNGVLELDNAIFRDGCARDITRQAVVDGEAECPAWLGFLSKRSNLIPDVRAWLQRFAGYCLTGRIDEQIFAVNHGLGANGKSVFWDTCGSFWEAMRLLRNSTRSLKK